LASEPASCDGERTRRTVVVCRLISVLCSLDIVKRVVTVKQVRPSPLILLEAGRGRAWSMGMRAADATRIGRGCRLRHGPEGQRAEFGDQKGKAPAAWPDVTPY
jgi:hypothetical protein